MSDGGATALDMDRLPWLTEHKVRSRRRQRQTWRPVMWWGVLAVLLVAGASYWFGRQSVIAPTDDPEELAGPSQSVASIRLPESKPEGVADVQPAPLDDVQPAPPPAPPKITRNVEVRAAAPRPVRVPVATPAKRIEPPKAPPKPAPLTIRSPWQSAGADGQMIRVGTFATRLQAKRGWVRLMKVYPGLRRLPAVVAPLRSARNGRVYYRLQLGTTSQAHSEVVCQRMRMVALSCVVVGLGGR